MTAEHAENLLLFLDFPGLYDTADGEEEQVEVAGF